MTHNPILKTGKETLDDLLHGELKLIQHQHGYRYSVDALLLADFTLPLVEGKRVLDMGTGTGVIALVLAQRGSPDRVVGVEVQPGLCDLARRNAALNPTRPKVEIIQADATRLEIFRSRSFEVIVTNPPFRPLDSGQVSPNPEKAAARHELMMNLHDWIDEAKRLLTPGGRICMVYPADREERLRQTVQELKLHVSRRGFAIDRPRGVKKLVLIELGARSGPTQELPEIPIETEKGKFSLDGYR